MGSYVSTPGSGYTEAPQLETRNASMHSGVLRLAVAVSWHCRHSVPRDPHRGCGLPSPRLIVSSLVSKVCVHEGPGRKPRRRLPARTGSWRSHCWPPCQWCQRQPQMPLGPPGGRAGAATRPMGRASVRVARAEAQCHYNAQDTPGRWGCQCPRAVFNGVIGPRPCWCWRTCQWKIPSARCQWYIGAASRPHA